MLDAQLNPWLIEINQGPTMATSTTVSNELVSLFIEDLCKVVLDRNLGPSRDVGDFDHIYRQQLVPIPRYIGNALTIEGKGLIKIRILYDIKFYKTNFIILCSNTKQNDVKKFEQFERFLTTNFDDF